jgi:hypothetical protein
MTKTKAQLSAEAMALGLPATGTKAEIQARIDGYWEAMAEAGHDTAAAIYVDGSDLGPVASGSTSPRIHPVNAVLIGGAAALISHLL